MISRRQTLVFGFMIGLGVSRSLANEVMLRPITEKSLPGQWEGAWRDKLAGRIIVFYVDIVSAQKGAVTIVQGSPENPFLEPFQISTVECAGGAMRVAATGSGDAQGATLTMNGTGSALLRDGQIDATIEKVTRGGRKLRFDVRLVKLEGGFFRQAEQLVEVAKKSSRTLTP